MSVSAMHLCNIVYNAHKFVSIFIFKWIVSWVELPKEEMDRKGGRRNNKPVAHLQQKLLKVLMVELRNDKFPLTIWKYMLCWLEYFRVFWPCRVGKNRIGQVKSQLGNSSSYSKILTDTESCLFHSNTPSMCELHHC